MGHVQQGVEIWKPLKVPPTSGGEPPIGAAPMGGYNPTEAFSTCFFPGEALLDSGIQITSVFTSPALRCVQTAKHILEGG